MIHHLTLIGAWLGVALIAMDLWLSVRVARPKAKRAEQRDDAMRAVAAAEQHYGPKQGQDKRQLAVQHLMSLHPGMKNLDALAHVENALSQTKRL